MKIAEILKKMITFSNGNIHDIDHLIKVWTYAKTIGELEGLDPETQFVLEVAAITHDIACPLCREKYGNANGKYQEIEGAPLVTEFLSDTGMTTEQISRVAYLVGHHHTLTDIKGMDYQILIEADYIVNASENGYSKAHSRCHVLLKPRGRSFWHKLRPPWLIQYPEALCFQFRALYCKYSFQNSRCTHSYRSSLPRFRPCLPSSMFLLLSVSLLRLHRLLSAVPHS